MGDVMARIALALLMPLAGIGVSVQPTSSYDVQFPQQPRLALQAKAPDNFSLAAKSAELLDLQSGVVIYEKNAQEPVPMASLTKLMTAYVIMQRHELTEVVPVGPAVSTIGGDSQRLSIKEGERFTVSEMLKGLLIYSANDVAVALASWDAGNEQKFVETMNDQAKKLGMKQTQFANASGLDAPGHVSSAHDLLLLSRIMLTSPTIKSIVKQSTATMTSMTGKAYLLTTTNQLLNRDMAVKGLKTGYTIAAGECLIAYIVKDGRELISIVLGSPNRFQETENLVNLSTTRIQAL
ncbi:MAG: D-alanyl-D-alanine carboxypeptidase family protein [bacterium]